MTQFIAFPKIKQFKDVVHNVRHKARFQGLNEETGEPIYDHLAALPKLGFRGTVKLHGTNAAVVLHPNGEIVAQSRKRVCTIENDNAGFAVFVHGRIEKFERLFAEVFLSLERKGDKVGDNPVAIYGEWCGSNIQGGVGLAELPSKRFVVFAVRIGAEEDTRWVNMEDFDRLPSDPDAEIYNILEFPVWDKIVDFDQPALARNDMVDITLAVEEECPVARAFGVEKGTGEGVVWQCVEPGFEDSGFWFKVKGEKHSVSKVKTLAPVDPEKMKNAQEFVDSTVTENRLVQGIQTLQEMGAELSMRSTGVFLKWVFEDIMSEEKDTLTASSLDAKTVSKPISEKARKWFFKYLEENL